jgi:hypothetical protein
MDVPSCAAAREVHVFKASLEVALRCKALTYSGSSFRAEDVCMSIFTADLGLVIPSLHAFTASLWSSFECQRRHKVDVFAGTNQLDIACGDVRVEHCTRFGAVIIPFAFRQGCFGAVLVFGCGLERGLATREVVLGIDRLVFNWDVGSFFTLGCIDEIRIRSRRQPAQRGAIGAESSLPLVRAEEIVALLLQAVCVFDVSLG